MPSLGDADFQSPDPRWTLVERVAASAGFCRSRRLQDLLRFVCRKEIRDGKAPTEGEVARGVFGRTEAFDPSEDTVVRVQASQLRRRLALYFATEGASEPVVIELSHGTYRPVFRVRPRTATVEPPAVATRRAGLRSWPIVLLVGTAGGLALLCAFLIVHNRGLEARLHPDGPRPAVDRLWRQMFANGRETYVVLGDSSLTTFQDLIGMQLSPAEYQQRQLTILRERLSDPTALAIAAQLAKQRYTSLADTRLAAAAVQLNVINGVKADMLLASDAGPGLFRSSNVILAGPRRSNPWLDLFEERLNFRGRSQFDARRRAFAFVNTRPRTGEAGEYAVLWGRTGYCRVAYLANLDRNGSVLLVTGSDMSSGEAGVAFLMSEPWIERLYERLGVGPRGSVPYFEVLLRTQLVASSISSFELVAHRTLSP